MISKKDLKNELGLPTVAVIAELLKASGRLAQGSCVEDADADLVRRAVPHWKAGHSYVEAVWLAKEPVAEEQHNDKNNGNGNSNASSSAGLSIKQKAQFQATKLAKENEKLRTQALITKAVNDAEKNQEAYWYLLAAAEGSEQVQQSERVTTARDFYYQVSSGQLGETTQIAELESELEAMDFFLSGVEALPLPAETESASYSSSADAFSYAEAQV